MDKLSEIGVRRLTLGQMRGLLDIEPNLGGVEVRLEDLGVKLDPVPIELSYNVVNGDSIVHEVGYAIGYGKPLRAVQFSRGREVGPVSLLFAGCVSTNSGTQVRLEPYAGCLEEGSIVGYDPLDIPDHEEDLDLDHLPKINTSEEFDGRVVELAEIVSNRFGNPTGSDAALDWREIRPIIGVKESPNGPNHWLEFGKRLPNDGTPVGKNDRDGLYLKNLVSYQRIRSM